MKTFQKFELNPIFSYFSYNNMNSYSQIRFASNSECTMPTYKIDFLFVADILFARWNPWATFNQQKMYSSVSQSIFDFIFSNQHSPTAIFTEWMIINSRELYYKNVTITRKQENVNETLKVICCLLDATPWQLGVLSTSKGLIAGSLKIHLSDNSIIDCSTDRNGMFSLFNYFFFQLISMRINSKNQ